MHVVQVLVLLAVEDVVVDDRETSKARARRGPPMTRGVFSEFAESAPTWTPSTLGLLALRAVGLPGAQPHDEWPPKTPIGVGSCGVPPTATQDLY